MKNIPTPIAVLVIIGVVVAIVLFGIWYLNRSSQTPAEGIMTLPQPVTPGGTQPGQAGQQGGRPVIPTY